MGYHIKLWFKIKTSRKKVIKVYWDIKINQFWLHFLKFIHANDTLGLCFPPFEQKFPYSYIINFINIPSPFLFSQILPTSLVTCHFLRLRLPSGQYTCRKWRNTLHCGIPCQVVVWNQDIKKKRSSNFIEISKLIISDCICFSLV